MNASEVAAVIRRPFPSDYAERIQIYFAFTLAARL